MADVSYNIPDLRPGEVFRVEQTIKRSRFIASVGHTPGVEEAKAFIEQIKAEFEDARHQLLGLLRRSGRIYRPYRAQAMTASLTEPPAAPC